MVALDFDLDWRYIAIIILAVLISIIIFFAMKPSEITASLEKSTIKPGETTYLIVSFKNTFSDYLQSASVTLEVGDPKYIKIDPKNLLFENMFRNDVRTQKIVVFASPETVPGVYNIKITVRYGEHEKVWYVPLEVKT